MFRMPSSRRIRAAAVDFEVFVLSNTELSELLMASGNQVTFVGSAAFMLLLDYGLNSKNTLGP